MGARCPIRKYTSSVLAGISRNVACYSVRKFDVPFRLREVILLDSRATLLIIIRIRIGGETSTSKLYNNYSPQVTEKKTKNEARRNFRARLQTFSLY